jgi:predicted kinase
MPTEEQIKIYTPNGTKKLIALRGLPASGKSTVALSAVKAFPGVIARVNNDDLSTSLFGKTFISELKNSASLFRNLRFKIINELLKEPKIEIIIIDNTNLTVSSIKDLEKIASDNNMEFIIDDSFLHVPLEECVARDRSRKVPVGEAVIIGMSKHLKSII